MTDSSSPTPVLDTLAAMTAESLARSELDERSLLAVRIAALAAVDAPAASYLMHVGPAVDAGLTVRAGAETSWSPLRRLSARHARCPPPRRSPRLWES